jgi:hypothetical protein
MAASGKWIILRIVFIFGSKGAQMSIRNGKRKGSTKLPGRVEKVIKPRPGSHEPEKAQIAVEGADHLYRELRVPNKLTDEEGNKVKLEPGTEVEVKIESEHATDAVPDASHEGKS